MINKRISGTRFPVLLCLLILFVGCQSGEPETRVSYFIPEQQDTANVYVYGSGKKTSEFAIATTHPIATDAGYQIIRAGGSAVDAAIAIQMVLTLVEPQSSGIGGGAFLMHWDGSGITAWNGRESAPSDAGEDLFLDKDGDPIPFKKAVHSGLSVGVPGTVAMLKAAHKAYGALPWPELFRPAITLAEKGFPISPRLHRQLKQDKRLPEDSVARALYYNKEGNALPEGHLLRNPALAKILRNIALEGISVFYEGPVAESIVERIRNHDRPGMMQKKDLAAYPLQNFQVEPICTPWGIYTICGFPPPSSGHLTLMQVLGIMEHLERPAMVLQDSIPSVQWLHQFLESSKLAFADRNRYIADPDFVEPPGDDWKILLYPAYLGERAGLIGDFAMEKAAPGDPGHVISPYGFHPWQPDSGTSHISIVDSKGNAVSMTTTIEQAFGSRIMSDGGTGLNGGFHLNNELTDFSLSPVNEDGEPVANRVEPGKRPRSSMSPSLIFDRQTGGFVAAVGSPGGAAIIHYTAKTILGMLDFGFNVQDAINLPNFANFNGPSVLEEGCFPPEVIKALEQMGHVVDERPLVSGIQAIKRTKQGFSGGSDPRREGRVMGD